MKLSLSIDCNVSLPCTSFSQINPSSPSSAPIIKLFSPLQRSILSLPSSKATLISHHGTSGRRLYQIISASSGDGNQVYESPSKALRRLLDSPGIHQGPACFDALSAKLIEQAGFGYCFTSGTYVIFLVSGHVLIDISVFVGRWKCG